MKGLGTNQGLGFRLVRKIPSPQQDKPLKTLSSNKDFEGTHKEVRCLEGLPCVGAARGSI